MTYYVVWINYHYWLWIISLLLFYHLLCSIYICIIIIAYVLCIIKYAWFLCFYILLL